MQDWTFQEIKLIGQKKFNLDGSDGFLYYYHDLRKNERIMSRHQVEGGSIMI